MMKRILTIVLLFITGLSYGQIWQSNTSYTKPKGVAPDSILIVPKDTAAKNKLYNGFPMPDSGRIAYYQQKLWLRNDTGWVKVGTDLDTTSLSARIDQKLNISDTTSMLIDYLRKADTTGKWKPLAWFPDWTEILNKPSTFTPSAHTHQISQVIGLLDSLNERYTKDQADARFLQGNQTITLIGDAMGSGTTNISTTLKNTGTAGTYTKVTTDAQGRVTSGTTLSTGDIPNLSATYIPISQKGAANGVATLGGDGKVPSAQLPVIGSPSLQGEWNASTNTPTLANGTGTSGQYYRVTTAGTQNLGAGNITFFVGDAVVYNGTIWQRDPSSTAVTSVNAMTGDVVLDKGDIGLGNVDNTPDLDKPISTATQTALNGKEPTIAAGTTAQYWRGDKSWQTLSTAVRPLLSAAGGVTYNSTTGAFGLTYGTAASTVAQGNDSRINNGQTAFGWGDHAGLYPLLSGSYSNPTWITGLAWSKITGAPSFEGAITAGTTAQYWRGDKTWQTLNTSIVPEGTNLYWTTARGDARYPLLSGSYANPTWLASVPWTKITGAPTSFPTSSTWQDVMSNGNTYTGSATIGANGNTNNYGYNVIRSVSSVNYTGSLVVSGGGLPGAALATVDGSGTNPNKLLYLPSTLNAPRYSPDGGVSTYDLWHSNNHPAGSAFTPILTGANVLSTLNVNSAGHITALTTRALTAGDISAVPSNNLTTLPWGDFTGTNFFAGFNSSGTNAPTGVTYFGAVVTSATGYGYQTAFRNNAGYFRTLEAGTYGSWLQFADRGWVTSNFAASSGSGNYIQNNVSATPQTASYRINGAATIQHDGSNSLVAAYLLTNAAATRGVNFQLNGDTNPGLATWIHNGTAWVKRQEYFADGKAQFYGQTLVPTLSGIAGTGTGTNNSSYFAFYESNGVTRAGYVGKGATGNNTTYLWSDIGNVQIDAGTTAGAAVNIIANGNANIDAGGNVNLTNVTKNILNFGTPGLGAPTLTTRSNGTKIVMNSTLSASAVDYALGMESGNMWLSVPNSAGGFNRYAGTTIVERLTGTGQHSVNTSYTAPLITSPTATSLTVGSATGESILFNPAGTNRGTWDADGRLGIGVTPSSARASLLEVNGNVWSTDAYILGTTSSPTAEFGLSGGGTNGSVFVRTMGTGNLDLQTGASETRVQINGTTGNVGIGVINPSYKLQVNGSIRGTDIAATGSLAVTGDVHFANENVSINALGQITTNGTLSVGGQITSSGGVEVAGGTLTIPTGAGANKVLTSDASGNASWANPTLPVATIQGSASLTSLPSTWNVVILNHTANNSLTISASYPGGFTGRVVQIINPTNFSYQISSTTYPAKSVTYVTWDNATTPAFTNIAQ